MSPDEAEAAAADISEVPYSVVAVAVADESPLGDANGP
jgi:hypothetical protein